MKVEQLVERIEKNQVKLTKKEALLEKKLAKMDLEINLEMKTAELWKTYYNNVDYGKWLEIESLKQTYEQVKEIKALIEKYNVQLNKAQIEENKLAKIPEVLENFRQYLIETWNKQDLNAKSYYQDEYKRLGYKEFVSTYKYTSYQHMNLELEDFNKVNTRDAEMLILNFISRVEEKAGIIEDCSGLIVTEGSNGYSVINGFVKGSKQNVQVESIGAGGYNIQKYHIRVLVK